MSSDRDSAKDLGGFHPVYILELLASRPIEIDERSFVGDLTGALGRVTAGDGEGFRLYLLSDVPVRLKDATVPAQIMILRGARGQPTWNVQDSLQHSWSLPRAEERLSACRHSMLLGDFMSSTLDHRMRRRMISSALRAAIGNSNTKLVHFVPTMQFLDAKDILTRLSSDEEAASPTYGFLNVRLFRIFDTPGDVVMDTLGLSALGLTDIQIRCRNLEPKAVAGRMHSLGRYLFEHGDVIETGDAVEGIAPGERWRCRHQESLLAPKRLVIDIDPGDAFASGNRRHA